MHPNTVHRRVRAAATSRRLPALRPGRMSKEPVQLCRRQHASAGHRRCAAVTFAPPRGPTRMRQQAVRRFRRPAHRPRRAARWVGHMRVTRRRANLQSRPQRSDGQQQRQLPQLWRPRQHRVQRRQPSKHRRRRVPAIPRLPRHWKLRRQGEWAERSKLCISTLP